MNLQSPNLGDCNKFYYICKCLLREKRTDPVQQVSSLLKRRKKKYKLIKTIGASKDSKEIDALVIKGELYIKEHLSTVKPEFDFEGEEAKQKQQKLQEVKAFVSDIDKVLLNGHQQILNRVFDSIGFQQIEDPIFRNLVLARLSYPSSKRATVEYLKSYFDEDIHLHKIYRYLDKLNDIKQSEIQKISVSHTLNIHNGTLGVLFYDVTTLYFETDTSDDLRQTGFSKDGKHSNPQIVLGLLVSKEGCPLAYSIHKGNQYEGHTLLPTIKDFITKYQLSDFIIVADSGMLNKNNIEELEKNEYQYIIGAKIKNEKKKMTQWILSLDKQSNILYEKELNKRKNKRLIISYSAERAGKDAYNREKGIKRLEKQFATGTITKDKISKRGYNKFLSIAHDKIAVSIDYQKIAEDQQWDGLKGYITNSNIANEEVLTAYHQLYNVEQSFRIAKSTLEIRPMFHFNENRIKAHISICFVALKVYKELDRILKTNKIGLSVDKVLDIAKTIVTIKVKLNSDNEIYTQTLFLTSRQKSIRPLFEDDFWGTAKLY